jgi:hypothetical protein
MVIAGKVFKLAENMSVSDVGAKLQNYHTEEPYEEDKLKCTLISEVANVILKENTLQAEYSHDYIIHVVHRDKVIPTPQTVRAFFQFITVKQNVFLVIIQKKSVANFVANKLSELLVGKVGGVLEARIAPETIKEFQMENPEDTKITFFDNIDIPNMDKISLYGLDLNETSLFGDYCKH